MDKVNQPIGYAVSTRGGGYDHLLWCPSPEMALHLAENLGPDVEIMEISQRLTIEQLRARVNQTKVGS